MDPDESVTWVIDPEDYKADVLFVFENGRVARVALAGYATKTNRKRSEERHLRRQQAAVRLVC